MTTAAWQLVENVSGDLVIDECMIVVDHARTAVLILMLGLYRDALTVTDALGRVFTQFGGRIEVLASLSGPPSAVSGSASGG
jgi:hypothetical protein